MNLPINEIVCGDCLEVMKDWPDGCVDLVVTSPPYDNLRDYKGYSFDFENIAQQLYRITKIGGVVVWVVGDRTIKGSETGTSFRQALYFKQLGFNLHDTMIYAKNGFAFPEATRYQPIFEYMFVLSMGIPKTFNPIKRINNWGNIVKREFERQPDGTVKSKDDRYILKEGNVGNVWVYNTGYMHSTKDKAAYEHPAIFPDQLAIDHILSWSNKGDIVADIFSGSGTTCRQSKILGRNYIGIDISEEYCEIARMRLKAVETGVPVAEQKAGQQGLFE